MVKVYKKRRVVRKRAYKKRLAKPSKVFAKKVQSVINKNAEDKMSYGQLQNLYYNSGITGGSGDCVSLITAISKGTDDNQRIGDQCRLRTHWIKGCIQMSSPATNISNVRFAVRVMIIQPKQFNNVDDAIAASNTWQNYLLKKGGTTVPFTGVLSDLWAPLNTDAITKYYDKRFYMNTSYQTSGTQATSTTMPDSIKFFNVKVGRQNSNKLLRYDSNVGAGLTPTNYAPIFLVGYVKLDGSAPDVINTYISCSFDNIVTFQDL